jgi:tetratricopeptide (TPR) repeat protein
MNKTDLPSAEAAAVDFEKKFPDSDLKGVLYQHLMDKYQEANNAPKMLEMARKVIQFEPDDPVALSTAATILAETTHDTDPDRDQRFAESEADARHAIASIDTLPSPANWTLQQFQQAKNVILSYAHAAIGFVELRKGNNVDAEKELRTATQLNQTQPDAPTWYRLALALDHQQKYADALAAINHALDLFHPDDAMYSVAKDEQARLTQILGQSGAPAAPSGGTGPAATAPSASPNPNPAGSKPAVPANPAPPPPKR